MASSRRDARPRRREGSSGPGDGAGPATVDWGELTDVRGLRSLVGLGQSQMATLLGVSPRTIQSCEQGWRKPSPALEKVLVLTRMAHINGESLGRRPCWEAVGCSVEERKACLAFRSRQGHLCWFLTGNVCRANKVRSWREKKAICGRCPFFRSLLGLDRSVGKGRG